MRLLLPSLILSFCLILISCSRHHLPPIKDSAALQKDCSNLYQQFPADEKLPTNSPNFDYQHDLDIRIIPKDKWSDSILALHPYMVCSYQNGIQIWIQWSKHYDGEAYFVAFNPELPPPSYDPSNDFIFTNSTFSGIYEVRQKTQSPYHK
jgi:hypothetical protein